MFHINETPSTGRDAEGFKYRLYHWQPIGILTVLKRNGSHALTQHQAVSVPNINILAHLLPLDTTGGY